MAPHYRVESRLVQVVDVKRCHVPVGVYRQIGCAVAGDGTLDVASLAPRILDIVPWSTIRKVVLVRRRGLGPSEVTVCSFATGFCERESVSEDVEFRAAVPRVFNKKASYVRSRSDWITIARIAGAVPVLTTPAYVRVCVVRTR